MTKAQFDALMMKLDEIEGRISALELQLAPIGGTVFGPGMPGYQGLITENPVVWIGNDSIPAAASDIPTTGTPVRTMGLDDVTAQPITIGSGG